jgi:DNA polymerase
MLLLRIELAKTSIKKYQAMSSAIGSDNRIRGLFQYYGANRTGRWSGRLVQPQNLPKNSMSDLDAVREYTKDRQRYVISILYGSVSDALSQLLRTAFTAPDYLVCTDFSAIEARVIAWLADEEWRLEVFRTHGKIYEASAAQMFKVPVESIDKKNPLRQRGKVAELACGYGGGVNALKAMGALEMGIPEEDLQELIDQWRASNPNIVKLWKTVEWAAVTAVQEGKTVRISHGVAFGVKYGHLLLRLPSGRILVYRDVKLVTGKFGGKSLQYKGVNQETKQWGTIDTYSGKLVENIVQAIARDCLAEAIVRIKKAGYKIVMHVHDEIVVETDNTDCLGEIDNLMAMPISWAEGLYLPADSYATKYYKKED